MLKSLPVAVRLASIAVALISVIALPARAQLMEGVAAIVNDEVITTYDLEQRARLRLLAAEGPLTPEFQQRVYMEALRTLINERIQLQEAREWEVEVDDEQVAAGIANLARSNNMSAESIVLDLAQRGINVATLEQQLRAAIAFDILVDGRFRSRVRVSDDQIDHEMQRMAANADKPSYHYAEILIPPLSQQETQQAIQIIGQQLNRGVRFSDLARQISAAPSRVTGGEVGIVRAGQVRIAEIEEALAGMEPGTIRPVQTREGVYVILLIDKRQGVELERLRLSQIFLPYGANTGEDRFEQAADQLNRVRRRIRSCDDVEEARERIEGAISPSLGLVSPSELFTDARLAVSDLRPGDTSEPVNLPTGAAIFTLCERLDMAPEMMPSREDVENDLLNQQLALYEQRYLRDLVDAATIETRAQ